MRYLVAALAALTLVGAGGAGADPLLALEPCTISGTVRALCGTLSVWEDREAQSGRRIALNVAVVPATRPAVVRVPLFYLAGGPGGAATSSAGFAANVFRQRRLTQDLVFVDQRGTGASHPLSCPDAPPQLVAAATPAAIAAYIEECLAALDGDPRFYTTAVAMDDLDEVRAALGYTSASTSTAARTAPPPCRCIWRATETGCGRRSWTVPAWSTSRSSSSGRQAPSGQST